MKSKYIIVLTLILLAFLSLASFAQEIRLTMEQKKAGITQLKEAVDKLDVGMTLSEVKDLLGEPMLIPNGILSGYSGPRYSFVGGQNIRLGFFEGKLSDAYNKDGFNLLLTEYIAQIVDFPVLINGNSKGMVTTNAAVTIRNKVYLPIESLTEPLEIKVSFNEEKQNSEHKITGITQMVEAISKINKGMTIGEVVRHIGEPTQVYSFTSDIYYSFGDTETIKLLFIDDKLLSTMYYRDNIDLLSAEYITANIYNFTILLNGEEPLTSNPIVTINDKVYVPIEDLAEQLGITVNFNEEKQLLVITTIK